MEESIRRFAKTVNATLEEWRRERLYPSMCIRPHVLCKRLPISSPCPSIIIVVGFCEAPHCSALPPERVRCRPIGFPRSILPPTSALPPARHYKS
jgi:hypothetical protein